MRDYLITRRIEKDYAPDSADHRYTAEAMCTKCGKAIHQAITIPKFAREKRSVLETPSAFFREDVVSEQMLLAISRNHGERCPKRIIIAGGNA